MSLTEDQRMVQDAVRNYVTDQIAPFAAQWDKDHSFPADALRGLAELGCFGITVPEQYGGAGLDYVSLALII